ncbi:hypothetical protein BX600DRAFT_385310 [Xylariales sp. PMI_506]|nr:hypothetical protein BX600DRAFT_385310 [Xylariales sp. PMI_506]
MAKSTDPDREISVHLDPDANQHQVVRASIEEQSTLPCEPKANQITTDAGAPRSDQKSPAITDVGWDEDKTEIAQQLVEGLSNEELWIYIRRFNKQVFHIRQTSKTFPSELDFEVSEDEEFSPNKLRAQVERLYMGVKVYFASWFIDYLFSVILVMVLALMGSAKVRRIMFPAAPVALVDTMTGGLSKPGAGVLGSFDSITGAPENTKGEAVENEASNFVTGIAAIATNILTDKDPQHHAGQKGGNEDHILPKPNALATKVAVIKDKSSGIDRPSQDKTKAPMEMFLWSQMRPVMHSVCVMSDYWERCTKYVGTLGFGIALFGDPIIWRVYNWLTLHNLTIYNVVFGGIPTDAQVTITLLRLAEADLTPLPPPPVLTTPPPPKALTLDDVTTAPGGDRLLGSSQNEIYDAAEHDSKVFDLAGGGDREVDDSKNHGKLQGRVLNFVKGGAKFAARMAIGGDYLLAKAGKKSAKNRIGAPSSPSKPSIAGPVEFKGRYKGDTGFIYLTTDSLSPSICFSVKPVGDQNEKGQEPKWIVPIAEITELNKYSGYGTKAKLLAGWAMDLKVLDGLEIIDKQGEAKVLTAIPRRDELFNRLCSIGPQNWEML